MNLIDAKAFVDFGPDALEAYAREKAADVTLIIPDIYRSGVQENLAALQTHAAILAVCFQGSEP